MKHSENLDKLFDAYVKFQDECPEVVHDSKVKVKTKKGGQYTFSYATLGNIQRTTTPVLTKHGLSVLQLVGVDGGVTTVLLHKSGQFLESDVFSIVPKTDEGELPTPQEIGSSVTYAKRYQLAGMLNIDAMKDDDGNHGSGNEITQEQVQQPVTKKPKPTKKSQSSPKPDKVESKPEPTTKVDDADADGFIASVKTKDELIKWWGSKINGENEEYYRTNYMKVVMGRLQELS